eukprot:symbB.v1.2.040043.t1/scaffold6942.1/size14376/1
MLETLQAGDWLEENASRLAIQTQKCLLIHRQLQEHLSEGSPTRKGQIGKEAEAAWQSKTLSLQALEGAPLDLLDISEMATSERRDKLRADLGLASEDVKRLREEIRFEQVAGEQFDEAKGWTGRHGHLRHDGPAASPAASGLAEKGSGFFDGKKRAALIAKLKTRGDWERALSLLFAGHQDLVLFSSCANVCAKASAWRTSVSLLDELQAQDLEPDLIFWTSLGDAYSFAGKWQHALWALLQEPQKLRLDLSAVSYAASMTACERVSYWEQVLNLLDLAKVAGRVNAYSYSSAIISSETWQRSLSLWNELRARDLGSPNVVAMNATLTALERGSQWKLACDLLKSSLAACDAVSYSACATACAKASAWQLGLQYLLTASEKKLRPGPSSFSYVARQMGHHGAWQEALQLLSLLQDYDQGVKFEVWCSVMWAMDVSGQRLPSLESTGRIVMARGRKEVSLLEFVITRDFMESIR